VKHQNCLRVILIGCVARSSWSRARLPIVEIGDLPDNEGVDFLENKRGMKRDDAEQLVQEVSGELLTV
jgi:hypothetical protein